MSDTEHQSIEALALAALNTLSTSAPTSPDGPARDALHSDYYHLLNIAQDADDATIQQALDAQRQRKELPVEMRAALHNAAAVLLNADLRARYNASL